MCVPVRTISTNMLHVSKLSQCISYHGLCVQIFNLYIELIIVCKIVLACAICLSLL